MLLKLQQSLPFSYVLLQGVLILGVLQFSPFYIVNFFASVFLNAAL